MTEKVVFEDLKHRIYITNRKDYDLMLKNNPQLKKKICELITVYHSESYTGLAQQLLDNGMIK